MSSLGGPTFKKKKSLLSIRIDKHKKYVSAEQKVVCNNLFKAVKLGMLGKLIQAWIAQLVVFQLGTMVVVGSNPGKGELFMIKQ